MPHTLQLVAHCRHSSCAHVAQRRQRALGRLHDVELQLDMRMRGILWGFAMRAHGACLTSASDKGMKIARHAPSRERAFVGQRSARPLINCRCSAISGRQVRRDQPARAARDQRRRVTRDQLRRAAWGPRRNRRVIKPRERP
jgi:hypothetical protein